MSSSEDYLDNLLASALQKNENQDSDGSGMSSLDLGTDDNPNRMMSEEEIAALFQNLNTEQEMNENAPADLSRFGKQEEISESVSDALSNHKEEGISYSSVNIDESVSKALSNAKDNTSVYSSVNVEESVSDALAKPRETEIDEKNLSETLKEEKQDKTKKKENLKKQKNEYTLEEIENKADELLSVFQDDNLQGRKFDNSNVDTDDDTDGDIEDNIDARLKAAEQQGINDAAQAGLLGLSFSEEAMDFTDFVDSKGIQNNEVSQVSELLKKSDEGKLIDAASLPKQNSSIDFAETSENVSSEEHGEEPGTTEESAKKKKKKEKKFGEKRKNDVDAAQEGETDNAGIKKGKNKEKNKEKNPTKKKKGLFWFLSKDKEETEQKNSGIAGITNEGNQMNATSFGEVSGVNEPIGFGEVSGVNEPIGFGEVPGVNAPKEFGEVPTENTPNELANADGTGNLYNDPEIIVPLDNIQFGETLSEPENNEKNNKKKKENIFTKLFHLLTEEVEEDEVHVPEQDATKLSQENLDILSALDAAEEDIKGKKKKEKKKKEKKEKEKKAKPKPKKKKKPAQETKEDTKQIPRKHIMKTAAMAVSLLVILLLLCLFLPEKLVVGEARDAYYQEDYKTVFLSLYGKELNESDRLIYDRSKLIVLLERKFESYVNFKALGMKLEALNSLLEGLQRYDDIIERGEQLNIKETLDVTRGKIIDALLSDYALTENEALEILQYSDLDYSNRLSSIVDGTDFTKAEDVIRSSYGLSDQNVTNSNDTVTMPLPDLLPEELEYQQSLISGDMQPENSTLQNGNQNENGDSQNSERNENMENSDDENENASSGNPFIGGAINQNGQSLQLQIESEQF